MSAIIVFLIYISLFNPIHTNEIIDQVSNFINKFEQKNYNKNIRPNYGGEPVHVNFTMTVRDISSISEVTMDLSIDIIIRYNWNDERLAFNETEAKTDLLVVGADFGQNMWLPDTFFINAKDIKTHSTMASDSNVLLRIKSNGDVLHSTRYLITASCPLDLRYFPMDSQVCGLKFSSYGYSENNIEYHWAEVPNALVVEPLNLPTFELRGERRWKTSHGTLTGNYSRLVLELLFTRSKGFYINQIYIPAALIVIISWVPFWLESENSHARVALTVTTVLTITTLISNANESLPKISYIKAIDVYLIACFLMVFASLLGMTELQWKILNWFLTESSIAEYWEYIHRTKSNKQDDNDNKGSVRIEKVSYTQRATFIDKISRYIFTISFLLFNIIYWIIYLNVSPHNPNDFNLIK